MIDVFNEIDGMGTVFLRRLVVSDCTIGVEKYQGMQLCSVGQLHADTIGRPGLLNLWILGNKKQFGCFG